MLVVGKEASTLITLHGIANCVKNGTTRKLYPPTDVSLSQQCRPELLSVKFENLVHSIFRKKNSTLEINVSHFRVLHWQQWQPPASAPGLCVEFLQFSPSFSVSGLEEMGLILRYKG